MAIGNAEPESPVVPGISALGLNRVTLATIAVGLVLTGVPLVTIAVMSALHVNPLAGVLLPIAFVGIALTLAGRVLGFAAARRADLEAAAGYTTISGRPNLPRRDPRTGLVISSTPIQEGATPRLNAVSDGAQVMGHETAAKEARFERSSWWPLWVFGGAIVFGVTFGVRFAAATDRGDDPVAGLIVGACVLGGILVIVALFLIPYTLRGVGAVNAVLALRPDAVVFLSAATTDGNDAWPVLGAIGKPPLQRFTVAADHAGLEFRRFGEADPFARIPWMSVTSIEPGRAVQRFGNDAYRALMLTVPAAHGDAIVPVPVLDTRNPFIYVVAAPNARLDDVRRLWRAAPRTEAQRTARNHNPARGGSVSSTEAGRPFHGSSEATTEP